MDNILIRERGYEVEQVRYEVGEDEVVTIWYENGNMRRMTYNYFKSIIGWKNLNG